MDISSVYVSQLLPKAERFIPGQRSCKGCGKALATRIASKAISDMLVIHAGIYASTLPVCPSRTYDPYETESLLQHAYEAMHVQTASALQRAGAKLSAQPKPVIVINRHVFQHEYLALSSLFATEHHALYLCLDNEHYLNEFVARTGPLPLVVNEVRHPVSEADIRLLIHEKNSPPCSDDTFSYIATACPSFPFDLIEKVRKGLSCNGNAFILVLAPCPTGWIFPPRFTKQVGRAAVQTGYFPLYEKTQGKLQITQQLEKLFPLHQYLSLQRRFFTVPATIISQLQDAITHYYNDLVRQSQERF